MVRASSWPLLPSVSVPPKLPELLTVSVVMPLPTLLSVIVPAVPPLSVGTLIAGAVQVQHAGVEHHAAAAQGREIAYLQRAGADRRPAGVLLLPPRVNMPPPTLLRPNGWAPPSISVPL